MTGVTTQELLLWSAFIKNVCGNIIDDKAYLLESRLSPIANELKCSTWMDLYSKVRNDIGGTLKRKVINAITTNETSFFRDTAPFEMLKFKILPDLIDRRKKQSPPGKEIPIRIWSAASSNGQELYSIAISVMEMLGSTNGYDIRLLGTDISDAVVAKASHGFYSKMEVERGLNPQILNKYFTPAGNDWKVRDEIRALATFKTINLLEPLSLPHKFDVIFCRNVSIYFNSEDRKKMFTNVGKMLAPDGYLIIGSTESISVICPEFQSFRYMRSIYYQLT